MTTTYRPLLDIAGHSQFDASTGVTVVFAKRSRIDTPPPSASRLAHALLADMQG